MFSIRLTRLTLALVLCPGCESSSRSDTSPLPAGDAGSRTTGARDAASTDQDDAGPVHDAVRNASPGRDADAAQSPDAGHRDASAPAAPEPGASALVPLPAADGSYCRFSPDRRQLLVSLRNELSVPAPATTVQLSTIDSDRSLRLDTTELKPGQTVDLAFERGPLIGFASPWRFEIAIGPDDPQARRVFSGECSDLRSRARAGMDVLQGFYDEASGLYNRNAWWTGANMLEVTIDYSRETGDPSYAGSIDNTFVKVKDGSFMGFVDFLNEYYDDEGWWALAWIKAYDLSHDSRYLDMARRIFDDMKTGWNAAHCGGGLYWRKTDQTKNAIPNELFLTVAARLHLRTPGDGGADSYLEQAEREWDWFQRSGMLGGDSQIVDGLSSDCKPGGPAYTYNQGVILGGLVDLWRGNGDDKLLDIAESIARAAIAHQTTPDGIFIEAVCDPDCGGGDGLQFKGIFARNVAYLYAARPRPEFQAFLIRQSDAIWQLSRSAKNQFGKRWAGPFDEADPSRQSSALDAILGAVRVANMNLALGSSASGSAPCNPNEAPERAVDGNALPGSKWCSGGQSGQSLGLDLGASFDLVGFRVQHAGAGHESSDWNTRAFKIETSADTQTWAAAVSVQNNSESVSVHDIPLLRARHVRLQIQAAQSGTQAPAARIYELEVLGIGR